MIQLLGRNNSVHTQKVMWCLAEIGLPIERLDVGGAFGGNTDHKYLAMNPNGTVPTLIDGDFVMWESNSIVRYLAQKYGKAPWQPRSLEHAGLAGQWMDWTTNAVIPPVRTLFSVLMRTKPEDRDMGQVRIARRQAIGVFAILNAHLEKQKFVAGDEPMMSPGRCMTPQAVAQSVRPFN